MFDQRDDNVDLSFVGMTSALFSSSQFEKRINQNNKIRGQL